MTYLYTFGSTHKGTHFLSILNTELSAFLMSILMGRMNWFTQLTRKDIMDALLSGCLN